MKYLKLREAFVNSDGKLKRFYFGKKYDYEKMDELIKGFKNEYGEHYNLKQGWEFFHNEPREQHEGIYKSKNIIEIQSIDDPEDWSKDYGVYVLELKDDIEAWEAAKKVGFMIDDQGVVYGYEGITCLEDID